MESCDFINLALLWFRDKSVSGHSVTLRETVAVTSAEINGATAYEVSGRIASLCFRFLILSAQVSTICDLILLQVSSLIKLSHF